LAPAAIQQLAWSLILEIRTGHAVSLCLKIDCGLWVVVLLSVANFFFTATQFDNYHRNQLIEQKPIVWFSFKPEKKNSLFSFMKRKQDVNRMRQK